MCDMETPPQLEVAAAVLLSHDRRRFLLACRPEYKVYAGYWEFPGGKIEAGESVEVALKRELKEELGIVVTAASPWLTRHFSYPHAYAHIHFWRVTEWQGEVGVTYPIEHSAICWQTIDIPCKLSPLLPANLPILQALALPTRMLITQAEKNGVEAEIERLELALRQGVGIIQIRDRTLSFSNRYRLTLAALQLAASYQAFVLVSEDGSGKGGELARLAGAHGIHLTAQALLETSERPPHFSTVGASCHNQEELRHAQRLELDYTLLGPILPTPSHPEHPGLGWPRFAELARGTPCPIFAIGGQNEQTLPTAQNHGAHGIASIRLGK